MNEFNDKRGGILFERDPVRHRAVAKRLLPAFSSRSVKAKEGRVHKKIDFFVSQMRTLGKDGINLSKWCEWVAMDISACLGYTSEMDEIKNSKSKG
jgi:hypothetical protein